MQSNDANILKFPCIKWNIYDVFKNQQQYVIWLPPSTEAGGYYPLRFFLGPLKGLIQQSNAVDCWVMLSGRLTIAQKSKFQYLIYLQITCFFIIPNMFFSMLNY